MNCSQCGNEIPPEKIITIKGKEDWCYDCYKAGKKTICVDFDGVLAQYSGWKGPEHLGEPIPGVVGFLIDLNKLGYQVVIHTTRDTERVRSWLIKHALIALVYQITNTKVPAVAYIDDRAICFNGSFSDALFILDHFKPHWKSA